MAVDKSPDRVRRMFGEIAGRYDFLNHLLSFNVDRYWRWRTVRVLRPTAEYPILDVCCGTGDLAFELARRTSRGCTVVGSDFCHEMLVLARRKAAKGRIGENVSFVEADTQQLPFADGTFQVVSVAFGLRNVSDTDAGLREMIRVCRVGGKVAVLEFSQPTFGPFRMIYGWYFRNVLPRIGQWLARNRSAAYNYLPSSVGEFPTGKSLAERMRQCGLRDVAVTPLTLGIATLYVGVKANRP